MKSLSILIFVFIILMFVPNSFAQVVSQRHLPEGVKARIGKGSINDSAYSPDGVRLACAGPTGIWMYNAHTGEQISWLVTSEVNLISFSPDGRTLAGCVWYGDTVSLWDAYTGDLKDTLESEGEYFRSVAYSPDGSTLAVISSRGFADGTSADDTVRLWNVVPGQPKTSFIFPAESPGIVRFSPDGRTLAVTHSGALYLWDVNTRDLKATLELPRFARFAYSPDGLTLAITDRENDTVTLWDATTGKLKFRIEHRSAQDIAYSPDGLTLASTNWSDTVTLWDATTGKLKTSFTSGLTRITGLTRIIYSVKYSPDGLTLALYDATGGISLCDPATGHPIDTVEGHLRSVNHVAYSPDGRMLAIGNSSDVNLWDAATGHLKATLNTYNGGYS